MKTSNLKNGSSQQKPEKTKKRKHTSSPKPPGATTKVRGTLSGKSERIHKRLRFCSDLQKKFKTEVQHYLHHVHSNLPEVVTDTFFESPESFKRRICQKSLEVKKRLSHPCVLCGNREYFSRSRIQRHIQEGHVNSAVKFMGVCISQCKCDHNGGAGKSHFHCMFCVKHIQKKLDYVKHIQRCWNSQGRVELKEICGSVRHDDSKSPKTKEQENYSNSVANADDVESADELETFKLDSTISKNTKQENPNHDVLANAVVESVDKMETFDIQTSEQENPSSGVANAVVESAGELETFKQGSAIIETNKQENHNSGVFASAVVQSVDTMETFKLDSAISDISEQENPGNGVANVVAESAGELETFNQGSAISETSEQENHNSGVFANAVVESIDKMETFKLDSAISETNKQENHSNGVANAVIESAGELETFKLDSTISEIVIAVSSVDEECIKSLFPGREQELSDNVSRHNPPQSMQDIGKRRREYPKALCAQCGQVMLKVNINRHMKTKHNIDDNNYGIIVDVSEAIYMVRKTQKGINYPIHVQMKLHEECAKVHCESTRCKENFKSAVESGRKSYMCDHLQLVQKCNHNLPKTSLSIYLLQNMSETISGQCLSEHLLEEIKELLNKSIACGSELIVQFPCHPDSQLLHFSVFDQLFSKVGRCIVTFDIVKDHMFCACSPRLQLCVHKAIGLWYLAHTRRNNRNQLHAGDMPQDPSSMLDCVYPPPMHSECMSKMAEYHREHKYVPWPLPEHLIIRDQTYNTVYIPRETHCYYCGAELSPPIEITSTATIVTKESILEGVQTCYKVCVECKLSYRYQEHTDGVHNYDDLLLVSLDVLSKLEIGPDCEIDLGRNVEILNRLLETKLNHQTLLQALMHFGALCKRKVCDQSAMEPGWSPVADAKEIQNMTQEAT